MLSESEKQEMDKIFYGNDLLLRGFSAFQTKAKGLRLPHKKLKFYYDNQEIVQLFKPVKARSSRNYIPITGKFPFQRVYFDTMFLTDLNITLVNCVDLFSKYGYSKSYRGSTISSTKASETLTEFIDIVVDLGYYIDTIRSDSGQEFKGAFKDLCKDANIRLKYTDPKDKLQTSPIEAFNRTIRLSIEKLRSSLERRVPIHVQVEKALPDILNTYNNTTHSQTGYSPIKILNDKNIQKEVALQNMIDVALAVKNKSILPTGTHVRIALLGETPFGKLSPNWSKELFVVKSYEPGKNRYRLGDQVRAIRRSPSRTVPLEHTGFYQDWQLQPINEKALMRKSIDTFAIPSSEPEFIKQRRLNKDVRDVLAQPVVEGKRERRKKVVLDL